MRGGERVDVVHIKQVSLLAGLALLILYFSASMMTGTSGAGNLPGWRRQEVALEQQLAHLQSCRAELQNRIKRLSADSLDLDFLEERAHALLFLASPDEVVIPLGPAQPPHPDRITVCADI